jgi:hypothetical protein
VASLPCDSAARWPFLQGDLSRSAPQTAVREGLGPGSLPHDAIWLARNPGPRRWSGAAQLQHYITGGRCPAPLAVVKAMLGLGSLLQEELLLAPFLRSRDLLRLSESAACLLPYRNQVGEIKIKRWRQSWTPAVLRLQRRLHTIRLGTVYDGVMNIIEGGHQ